MAKTCSQWQEEKSEQSRTEDKGNEDKTKGLGILEYRKIPKTDNYWLS